MINVLHIISNMGDGGAQKIVLNYINDLEYDNNIKLKLLVLSNKIQNYNENILKNKNIEITYLNCFDRQYKFKILNKLYAFINSRKKIKQYITNNKIDIVHIHLFGTLLYTLPIILKSKIKIRFYTLHSNPKRFNGYKLKILKTAFKKGNFIPICVTNEQVLIAKKHYNFEKYEVVHNGVDIEQIKKKIISKNEARNKFNISKNTFLICSVGRLDSIKRYDLLLNIFKQITLKKRDTKLLIAGSGNELENLKKQAIDLSIQDKVFFLGNIDNVTELYCASDTLVITSKSESASLVLLEAQICNLRAVISNGTPSESIITNKVIKMNEKATDSEWSEVILNGNKYEKANFKASDYEINNMSKLIKKIYLKYWSEHHEEK